MIARLNIICDPKFIIMNKMRFIEMMKDIYVVGAIIVKKDEIFCCQRGLEKTLAEKWEFPGGKIEMGETKQQALVRELVEELEISVEMKEPEYAHVSFHYDFGTVHLTTFICELKSGKPKLTEHLQARWVPIKQLNTLDWAPADRPIVQKLMEVGIDG